MGEHKNWFARNKGFVFGFAVAVAILNIVIFVLIRKLHKAGKC